MKELVEKVKVLVAEELKNANKKFPMFSSMHEGYAVIKEELEESKHELNCIELDLCEAWGNIKENRRNSTLQCIESLKIDALNLAAEAIQVAAMAQKFIDSEVME